MHTDQQFLESVKNAFEPFKKGVKRSAQGELPYDYLVPSGVYEEQWDWDAFFMGIALSSENPQEAIYLKNWVLNFVHNAREDGFTPGCVTPKGRDERLHQMKPFLAQGALIASTHLQDFDWIEPVYETVKKIVLYREKHLWNQEYNMGVWFDSMESGADNNIAALNFPNSTVIATDLNTFIHKEYHAMSKIADSIGVQEDVKHFSERAEKIKDSINSLFWNDEDGAYYNIDSTTGKHIERISYNSIHPLWAHLAPDGRAKRFITTYVLNEDKLWSPYGIRTLAKDDPDYNNANIIKPYSNWQGPIWPIANYFYIHALLNYGFHNEALEVAKNVAKVCLRDIKKTGGMHENYDAKTGEPLAAPNFISWNILIPSLLESTLTGQNNNNSYN